MSSNWEKLSQARRNFPKPRDALKEITRQRKKKPNDPYYLAWQAELQVQLGWELGSLDCIWDRSPPVADKKLLGYLYETHANAHSLDGPLGDKVRKAWTTAAKTLTTPDAKVDLYSEWFLCAIDANFWDDARTAVNLASREASTFKKTAYFTLALANQMRYNASFDKAEPVARLAQQTAQRMLSTAFDKASKSSNDPLQIEDERDLRFMAQVFSRQGKAGELVSLWEKAAPKLKKKMEDRSVEFMQLRLAALRNDKQWGMIYNLVFLYLKDDKPLLQSPVNEPRLSGSLWGSLLEAVRELNLDTQRHDAVGKLAFEAFEALPQRGREAELTRLALSARFRPEELLGLSKKYWDRHCLINSCFQDLRPFVLGFTPEEQDMFHDHISQSTRLHKPTPEDESDDKSRSWFRAEVNVLKFDYLLTVSAVEEADIDEDAVEAFIITAIGLYAIGSRIQDDNAREAGMLALTGLLVLHRIIPGECDQTPGAMVNSRILLQAGFLALHLAQGEAGDQNRPLRLLSTRLHLKLGLPTIAYQQYRKARVKEMLQDTLSYVFLNHISQIHPFDATGVNGFSPDEELVTVIGTITRMESRTKDLLSTRLQDFPYDQAIELLEFKESLSTSLTKNLCQMERRRIARFKGNKVDARLQPLGQGHQEMRDNRDYNIFPGFQAFETPEDVMRKIWYNTWYTDYSLPSAEWLRMRYRCVEIPCNFLFDEKMLHELTKAITDRQSLVSNTEGYESHMQAYESDLQPLWHQLGLIKLSLSTGRNIDMQDHFKTLGLYMNNVQGLLPTIMPQGNPAHDYVMIYESGLMCWFAHLELLQATWRACELARAALKKDHKKWKDVSPADIDFCADIVRALYDKIMHAANRFIEVLRKRGRRAIVAQARWGPTGEALKQLMRDEDQEGYAQDYVDSAIEALEGILKVKLK